MYSNLFQQYYCKDAPKFAMCLYCPHHPQAGQGKAYMYMDSISTLEHYIWDCLGFLPAKIN